MICELMMHVLNLIISNEGNPLAFMAMLPQLFKWEGTGKLGRHKHMWISKAISVKLETGRYKENAMGGSEDGRKRPKTQINDENKLNMSVEGFRGIKERKNISISM